jgi:CMP-N-acetylneuraminic acid synthetase
MFDNDKCIAIIPARGGSKRVKDKNVSIVGGRPLIEHTINTAKESKLFSQIFVNSESEKIQEISRNCGVDIYHRPEELSTDSSSIITVLKSMIKDILIKDDTIVFLLLPTSPLRSSQDLLEMYESYMKEKNKAVVSVTRFDTPIQLAQFIKNGKLIPVFEKEYRSYRNL